MPVRLELVLKRAVISKTYFSIIVFYCGCIANSLEEECSQSYQVSLNAIEGSSSSSRAEVFTALLKTNPSKTIAIKYGPNYDISRELQSMEYLKKETNKGNIRMEYNNFVTLIGVCTVKERRAIEMEYLPQILGKDVILAPPVTDMVDKSNYLTYAFHLVEAVETLQRIKLVHGDLQIDNVGFNAEGAIKVFDFGNSYMSDAKFMGISCAPQYAAPEMLLFEKISETLMYDTWSAGIIIYEMFSQKHFIDKWMADYEECERKSNGVVWKLFSSCSGRAFFYASRLNRCTRGDVWCARIYQDIEADLENKCTPNKSCLSHIEQRVRDQLEFHEKMESFAKDDNGLIRNANANTVNLIDLLMNMLSFDYTRRIKPQNAKRHALFKQFS